MNFSWCVVCGGGDAWAGGRRRVVAVVVEGRVVTVVAGHSVVAAAVEGRRFVVGGSRWLGWEVVESRSETGDKAVTVAAVVVAAADHPTHVSFAYS